MARYPEWINPYRKRGTTVKKVGHSYYLYKTKSVRVPGKKNPQPQSEYIGTITESGVITSTVKKLQTDIVRVYEYGFSHTLKQLILEKILQKEKKSSQEEDIFLHWVKQYSPTSYLLRNRVLPKREELHVNFSIQEKKYERISGVKVEELLGLQQIYLVEIGKKEMISEINEEQKKLLQKWEVRL